jgi:hypothetical protein
MVRAVATTARVVRGGDSVPASSEVKPLLSDYDSERVVIVEFILKAAILIRHDFQIVAQAARVMEQVANEDGTLVMRTGRS